MKKWLLLTIVLLVFAAIVLSQGQPASASVDRGEKNTVVEAAAAVLEKQYVFPEMAKTMAALLQKNLKAGTYDSIVGADEFARKLTEDMQSISHDLHLGVGYAPERIRAEKTTDEAAKKAALERQKKLDRIDNYGFKEIKILSGNIGYLKFNHFSDAQEAFRVAVGAMAFLANVDALIIDLRENGGGNPEMIQLLSSYFFAGDPKHLNSFYYRLDEKTVQFWTLPYVPGDKLAETDCYVLTSQYTFSGAEEFTYNLKNMKRATIVGETTGGGAHPVRLEILNDNFYIRVPFARAVNPISKANWEGTGVEPDVMVAAGQALEKAQALALEKLAARETDERIKAELQRKLEWLQAPVTPVSVAEDVLRSYVGTYGPRKITFENGCLFYQRENQTKMMMIPVAEDYFRFEEIDYFRLKIVKKEGQVTGVEGHYDEGTVDANPKTN